MNLLTRRPLLVLTAIALLPSLGMGACDKEPTTTPEPTTSAPSEPVTGPAEPEPEVDPEAEAAAEAERKAAEAKAALDEQIAKGQELFGANCASCHGDQGQGKGKTPKVVGEGALPLDAAKGSKSRKSVKFTTAADVAGYVVANMPPKKAGTLTPEEYYAILAFDLSANGIAQSEPLTEANAASIELRAAATDAPAEADAE